MPYPVIPAVLGTSFVLIWAFIGGMVLRDGQLEARRQFESESHLAIARRRRPRSPSGNQER